MKFGQPDKNHYHHHSTAAERATQRQWNQSNVKALNQQIDATLASQQRELPLSVDISYAPSSQQLHQSKNMSPPAFPSSTSRRPQLNLLPTSYDHTTSDSQSPVRVQWSPPPLSSLQKEQHQQQQSDISDNTNNRRQTTSSTLSDFPSFFVPAPTQTTRSQGRNSTVLMSPPSSASSNKVIGNDFPDLLNSSSNHHHDSSASGRHYSTNNNSSLSKQREHNNTRQKVKFQDTDPSFFLPIRGGSDHRALDSISMDQIKDAIEECPSRERRLAAQKALQGTVLDRQKKIFGGTANSSNYQQHQYQKVQIEDISAISGKPSVNHHSSFVNNNVSTTIISAPMSSSKPVTRNSLFLGRDQLLKKHNNTSHNKINEHDMSLTEITLSPLASEERESRRGTRNVNSSKNNDDEDEDLDAALEQACKDLEENNNNNQNTKTTNSSISGVSKDSSGTLPSGIKLQDVL